MTPCIWCVHRIDCTGLLCDCSYHQGEPIMISCIESTFDECGFKKPTRITEEKDCSFFDRDQKRYNRANRYDLANQTLKYMDYVERVR